MVSEDNRFRASMGKFCQDVGQGSGVEAEGTVLDHLPWPCCVRRNQEPGGEEDRARQLDRLPSLMTSSAVFRRFHDHRGIGEKRHGLVSTGEVRTVEPAADRELGHEEVFLADFLL